MDLIDSICGLDWTGGKRTRKTKASYGGLPVFIDGQKMTSDFLSELPNVTERFNQLLHEIYGDEIHGGVSPEAAVCGIMSHRWLIVARVIHFGRESGLWIEDWKKAVSERQRIFSRQPKDG